MLFTFPVTSLIFHKMDLQTSGANAIFNMSSAVTS